MKVESIDKGGSHKKNNGDDEGNNSGDDEGNNNGDDEGSNIGDGIGYDSWDDIYQAALHVGINEDDDDGGEDKGENGVNSEDGGENMAENAANNEDGGKNRDENETESNGRRGVSGRKDGNFVSKGGNGMKRKNQDDEPATRAKRSKGDVSGGHQAAAQPMKKAQPKKNLGKKKN